MALKTLKSAFFEERKKAEKADVVAEIDATAQSRAEEVARRTSELLATRGWCLWRCNTLGGEVIAVVMDENVEGVPEGYPVYIEAELEELFWSNVSGAHLRLVHEAKKLTGAKVTAEFTSNERR